MGIGLHGYLATLNMQLPCEHYVKVIYKWLKIVFMGCGFTSGGQESGSVFSAAVCKVQASKCYVDSLALVL